MNAHRVEPGTKVRLAEIDPSGNGSAEGGKENSLTVLEGLREEIRSLQRKLYAGRSGRLLVVLQAMDGGGKDGTVCRVFHGIDPHGFRAVSFKSPTPAELDRDFLWRVHREVPARGEIVVFNRSHYEDVVAARVRNLVPPETVDRRYSHIVNFERLLHDEGTVILKFFLHISPEEQRERLQARLDDPEKHWKFNPDDLNDRKLWPAFMAAYDEALTRTTTDFAPWHVVPANRKWYRNLLVAGIVRDTLQRMDPKFPRPAWDPRRAKVK